MRASGADILDPADPDPLRYVVLASLTKLMCSAFNRRIEFGLPRDAPPTITDFDELARPKLYEHPPPWAEAVPPLHDVVFLPDEHGTLISADDGAASEDFRRMNIIVVEPHIHFV